MVGPKIHSIVLRRKGISLNVLEFLEFRPEMANLAQKICLDTIHAWKTASQLKDANQCRLYNVFY
jgi:hypothetical protein